MKATPKQRPSTARASGRKAPAPLKSFAWAWRGRDGAQYADVQFLKAEDLGHALQMVAAGLPDEATLVTVNEYSPPAVRKRRKRHST